MWSHCKKSVDIEYFFATSTINSFNMLTTDYWYKYTIQLFLKIYEFLNVERGHKMMSQVQIISCGMHIRNLTLLLTVFIVTQDTKLVFVWNNNRPCS